MLTRRFMRGTQRAAQRGVVLVIALIVLVAMTLASIALIRSVDTTNIIAGNLAFQQSATISGDAAVETAITWLEGCTKGVPTCTLGTLWNDDATNGYSANGSSTSNPHIPYSGSTWDQYWRSTLSTRSKPSLVEDSAGNKTAYAIDRLCAFAGSPTGGASCASSPNITSATGNEEEAGGKNPDAPSLVYYRITVRSTGPRNTVSYIQVIVAL